MDPYSMFGPLDLLLPYIEHVILLLVLVNAATRLVEHGNYVSQYRDDGLEAMSRSPVHIATNVLLVLATFYYLTVDFHAGTVLSVLVLGLFVTDFFEFEARLVEARKEESLDRPKAALGAWGAVFVYAAYQSLFATIVPLLS